MKPEILIAALDHLQDIVSAQVAILGSEENNEANRNGQDTLHTGRSNISEHQSISC